MSQASVRSEKIDTQIAELRQQQDDICRDVEGNNAEPKVRWQRIEERRRED